MIELTYYGISALLVVIGLYCYLRAGWLACHEDYPQYSGEGGIRQ